MVNVLPDSRLRESRGRVVVDWNQPDGSVLRLEVEPVFCFNCGKPNGYVPCDVMSFVSWLCPACAEKWGAFADGWDTADDEFWRVVAYEMVRRFGRALSQRELEALAERGELGRELELLERISPYRRSG